MGSCPRAIIHIQTTLEIIVEMLSSFKNLHKILTSIWRTTHLDTSDTHVISVTKLDIISIFTKVLK